MKNTEITYIEDKFYMNGAFFAKRKFSHSATKHTHDFIEIVYVIKGKGTHIVDGRVYPVSSGDLLYVNYGSTHSFESVGGFDYVDILIKPEFVSESLKGSENAFSILTVKDFNDFADTVNKNNCVVSFVGEERRTVESLLSLMGGDSLTDDRGAHMIISSALNIILTMLFRKLSLPIEKDCAIDEKMLVFIKENCHAHITLESLAEGRFYNPSYFSRAFKAYAGMTFSEYLTECRIERARELLSSSDMSIEAIIGESGYSNRTKFFADFLGKVGTTPLKFRKGKK